MDKGLIHIYHGDGKGKTTCAVGLSIRALGAGYRVIFAQFLKGGNTSELNILEQLPNLEIIRCEKDYNFTWLLKPEELEALKAEHIELFKMVLHKCQSNDVKILVVLDELCATYELNLIDREMVMGFLKDKSAYVEVVITGRNPVPELLEVADYISEIKKEKHPMDKGIMARKGIEM